MVDRMSNSIGLFAKASLRVKDEAQKARGPERGGDESPRQPGWDRMKQVGTRRGEWWLEIEREEVLVA